MNFKQFLLEAAAGREPKYVNVNIEKAIALLNTHCKNALWMLEENSPIYRGDESVEFPKSGFLVVDTEATQRVSQNTSNYYTVIFDNHPERKNFPKRSRSFIASTNKSYASTYGQPFVIVPSDSAKIGFVNNHDMWSTKINLFGRKDSIENFNEMLQELIDIYKAPTINDFYKIDKLLKAGEENAIIRFKRAFNLTDSQVKKYKDHFLDNIWEAYSAKNTGHSAHTTATMPHSSKSEVWVGGKVVLIEKRVWDQMRKAYLAQ